VQRIIQASLDVSQPGDPYEREADMVADRIMSMPAAQSQPLLRVRADEQNALARVVSGPNENGVLPGAEEAVSAASNSIGQALPANLQGKFENALGLDLSGVRVHTGPESAEANNAISARAYTIGNDIHFNAGQYDPDSASGQRLLAHEVAHTVQQSGQPAGNPALSPSIQRKAPGEGDGTKVPVSGDSVSKTDAPAAAGNAPAPANAPAAGTAPAPGAAASQPKTVNLILTAIYEDVPGEAQDKVKRAKEKEALWLAPLTMLSNYPVQKRNTISFGVVAGGGQKTVDTYPAPVSDTTPSSGRGSISASLKYAGDKNQSFNVTVTGVKKDAVASAEAMARKTIEREITTFGDVDEIAATAEKELNAVDKYQGAKVSITVRDNKVTDAGSATFYYKVRSDAGIEMDLQAAPVGEKQTKYTGSKTSGTTTEDESKTKTKSSQEKEDISKKEHDAYKKTETSTETQDVDYNERVVKTLEDYVSKATSVHNELASDLSEDVIKHHEAKWGDKEETHRTAKNYTDYTKDSKHTVESGERDKENWAAKLQKGVKIVKDAMSIPYVDKIPGLGWLSRKLKGWELDVADDVLGIFAETGKVKFTDTKLDEDVKSHQDIQDDTKRERNVELKEDDKTEVKRKLTEDFKSKTQEDWERHMKEVTETTKTYRSKIKKDSQETIDKEHTEDYKRQDTKDENEKEQRRKTLANQSTTATFEVATTWKFTKPVVNATVTSGDAEVSHAPFGPDADELAGATKK
jgi:hypothetical protein